MDDARSRRDLEAEVETLRHRVSVLERERQIATRVVHGDPQRSQGPLLAQVPAIIWLTDTALRLTWWTGGGIASLGVGEADLIGTDIYAFLGTDDPNNPSIAAHMAALGGDPSSFEVEREGVYFSAHVSPHYDSAGAITGAVGVSIEITDRVQAEVELRQALQRVRTLSGLIPICMHCKNVRNDSGFWEQVETYVRQHSLAEFTHAICPECMKQALERESLAR